MAETSASEVGLDFFPFLLKESLGEGGRTPTKYPTALESLSS